MNSKYSPINYIRRRRRRTDPSSVPVPSPASPASPGRLTTFLSNEIGDILRIWGKKYLTRDEKGAFELNLEEIAKLMDGLKAENVKKIGDNGQPVMVDGKSVMVEKLSIDLETIAKLIDGLKIKSEAKVDEDGKSVMVEKLSIDPEFVGNFLYSLFPEYLDLNEGTDRGLTIKQSAINKLILDLWDSESHPDIIESLARKFPFLKEVDVKSEDGNGPHTEEGDVGDEGDKGEVDIGGGGSAKDGGEKKEYTINFQPLLQDLFQKTTDLIAKGNDGKFTIHPNILSNIEIKPLLDKLNKETTGIIDKDKGGKYIINPKLLSSQLWSAAGWYGGKSGGSKSHLIKNSESVKITNKTKRNKTKRNKTKRNKTKRNKTKRNKTKRNKTKKVF
jgi:hypothetical protein